MKPLLILDIDQTLADTSHRDHLLKRCCISCGSSDIVNYWGSDQCVNCSCDTFKIPAQAWQAFNNPNNVSRDIPFLLAQEFLLSYGSKFDIAVITGRQENLREVTSTWLRKNFVFGSLTKFEDIPLLMRPNHSFYGSIGAVPASQYKEEQLLSLFKSKKNELVFMFDDDPYVVSMYSKYGIAAKAPDCWYLFSHRIPSAAEPVFSK